MSFGVLPAPELLVLEQSRGCNLSCPMCAVHQSGATRDHRTLDEVLARRLREEALPGVSRLGLSVSGEPLLDPELDRWITWAEETRTRLRIVTNGTVRPRQLDRLLAVCDTVLFSVDTPDPMVFCEVRGGASLDRVLGTIRAFVAGVEGLRPRPWLGLSAVAHHRTLDDLPELVDLAAELGLDRVGVAHLSVFDEHTAGWSLRGQVGRVDRVFREARRRADRHGLHLQLPPGMDGEAPPRAGLRSRLADLRRWPNRTSVRQWFGSVRRRRRQRGSALSSVPCVYLRERLYVDLDGDVRPCCMPGAPVLGSLHEQSVAELWDGPVISALRDGLRGGRPHEVCAHCSVNPEGYDPADPATERARHG